MRQLILTVILLLVLATGRLPVQAQAPHPKLVVFVAVDQLRGDYPVLYNDLLDKGLHRLITDGAWYRHAAYPYLNTVTCAGHSTLGTGALPYQHGLIQNTWYDRESQRVVACTSDSKAFDVSEKGRIAGDGDSAARMLVPTLAETMRQSKARTVTISLKARSAIALAGHAADAVLFLGAHGELETSSAYSHELPAWVDAFVKAHPMDRDAGKVWDLSLPAARYKGSDELPGEKPGMWSTRFPHALGAAQDAAYVAHWETSPYSDEYLEAIAEHAVDTLHLGAGDHTDFLGVSFSSLDLAGHAFGPRSYEVQDMLVRLDATIGKLLAFLDAKVGAGNYVLALSADHGVAEVPEQTADGGRILPQTVSAAIEAALEPTYGKGSVAAAAFTDIYLKAGVFDRLRRDAAAMSAVTAALGRVPGIARVLTSDQVSTKEARSSKDPEIRAASLSYFAGRSGDLIVIPKQRWIFGTTTTTHGTLYEYDQHVPVILFGAGVLPGVHDEAVSPIDVAPTLAKIAGVPFTSVDGHVLTGALQQTTTTGPARLR